MRHGVLAYLFLGGALLSIVVLAADAWRAWRRERLDRENPSARAISESTPGIESTEGPLSGRSNIAARPEATPTTRRKIFRVIAIADNKAASHPRRGPRGNDGL
jgi:hypothetical protein